MSDYCDIATRSAIGSDELRKYPNAHVQIFTAGTLTLIWEDIADADGHWAVDTLATGKYDIKVDGVLVDTIHFVRADHTHTPDQCWPMSRSGAITGDIEADANCPIFVAPVAGTIIRVMLTAHLVGVGGDIRVHLLKGAADGSANITCASNSVWNRRVQNPSGPTLYRHKDQDDNPGISLAAGDAVTMEIGRAHV